MRTVSTRLEQLAWNVSKHALQVRSVVLIMAIRGEGPKEPIIVVGGVCAFTHACRAPWDEAAGVPRAWEWGRRHAPQMPGLEDDCKDGTVEQMVRAGMG